MNIDEAVALLQDDSLTWPEDLDAIRHPLANLLAYSREVEHPELRLAAEQVAECFVVTEELNMDEMERWLIEAGRALGVIEQSSRRERLAEQLKRLFGRL